MRSSFFVTMLLMFLPVCLLAKGSEATITRLYGKVQLLVNPAKTKKGPSPHALYKGKYYNVRKAKKAMKLPVGSVIKTGKRSKVKLIYPNGDQISVGSETFLKISKSKSLTKKVLDLFSGSIRAIVEKKGNDRQRVEVRTKSMVMGVRGTDFYVDAHNDDGDSTISVIRGKVEITPSVLGETIELESGYTMDIDDRKKKPVVISRNTKSALKKIYADTNVAADGKDSKEIIDLEKRAIKVAEDDIKLYDPELYEKIRKISKNRILSSSDLENFVTQEAIKQAPEKDLKPRVIKPRSKESIYK